MPKFLCICAWRIICLGKHWFSHWHWRIVRAYDVYVNVEQWIQLHFKKLVQCTCTCTWTLWMKIIHWFYEVFTWIRLISLVLLLLLLFSESILFGSIYLNMLRVCFMHDVCSMVMETRKKKQSFVGKAYIVMNRMESARTVDNEMYKQRMEHKNGKYRRKKWGDILIHN